MIPDFNKLVKMLNLLGSPFDKEALAAAQMTAHFMRKHKLSWATLLGVPELAARYGPDRSEAVMRERQRADKAFKARALHVLASCRNRLQGSQIAALTRMVHQGAWRSDSEKTLKRYETIYGQWL